MKFINCLNLSIDVASTAARGKLFHNLKADGKNKGRVSSSRAIHEGELCHYLVSKYNG